MKYLKKIFIVIVVLFSIIYTFDLSYLIKGVRVVYLNGYSTVFIDDNKYFDTVKVQTSNNPELWAEHINYNNEKTSSSFDEFNSEMETAAFLILGPNKNALFLPDIDKWDKWSMNIIEMLSNVDYAFIDATFYSSDEINRNIEEIPHPLVMETMDLLSDLPYEQRNKVYFIHMNHTNQMLDINSDISKNILKKGFNIARLGQKFHL